MDMLLKSKTPDLAVIKNLKLILLKNSKKKKKKMLFKT